MKRKYLLILLVTLFAFTVQAETKCVSDNIKQSEKEKIYKNIEHNKRVYLNLINDLSDMLPDIVSGDFSLKEKKIFLKKLQAKIRTIKFILEYQLDPNGRYQDITSSSQTCNACDGSGCKVCGWDGTVYVPADEAAECGRCGGDGIDPNGGACKGCSGSGWSDALPDPVRNNYD